jgi:hypothetical protein
MSPAMNRMEKLKNWAAILGAVASAIVGLYGVYEKVRSDARADTAASYNTLAPQVNQLGDALKQLQQENQQLREIVAHGQGKPRMAVVPAAANTKRRDPGDGSKPAKGTTKVGAKDPGKGADKGTNAQAPEAPASPPAADETPAAPGAPPTPESPTAANPTAPGTPAPEGAPTEGPAATEEDRITGLLRSVSRTREAIESLKKVPEDFGRVVGKE